MPLSAGDKLGPYEILGSIGAGGMGEVYRAHDSRLRRDVAIKVSAERFSERFETEARAIASLNHPNVCTLHDVGPNYLVMELVEGQTLAQRIEQGAVPLDEALAIARQIADALEAAHEKGITHRDLKPGNIKIKPDGVVKVLDFGLAKVTGPASQGENSPTLTMSATQAGVILGTAAYMSPEQARGKLVDKRADIWAFGVVLYEMLTGKRLFEGEDLTETLASVVKDAPPLEEAPASVRRLLGKCLEKNPKKRLRDIGDVWALLEEPTETVRPVQPTQRWLWPGVAVVLLVALGGISFLHFRETPPEAAPLRTTILPPDNTTFDFTNGLGLPAISPDGRRIVFGARTAEGKTPLWVRPLDALTAQPLAGTDGATFPFWSPDSRFIAFFAADKLKRMDAAGGPAITLADAPRSRGGSWSPLGVIIFDPGTQRIQRVSASGGEATPLTDGRLPWFLPDGRHFLYELQQQGSNLSVEIHVGSLDRGQGEDRALLRANTNAVFSQGHLLFAREGALMAQPFDVKHLVTTGEAVPVAERVQGVLNTGTAGVFSVSETGLLTYRGAAGVASEVLTWFDRAGKQEGTVGSAGHRIGRLRFSPDRKSLATSFADDSSVPPKVDIWIYDLSRSGLPRRLTFDGAENGNPVWSPDGQTVAFSSQRKEHSDLYRKSANGAGLEELLYADDAEKIPTSWSSDGKFLLYQTVDRTGSEIWALPITPNHPGGPIKPFPVVQQRRFRASLGQFSPDGRSISYMSNESGPFEIYTAPFPPGQGGKRQISNGGGGAPRWRQDGREIFYINVDLRLLAADVATGEIRALFNAASSNFEVAADGQHFLISASPEQKSGEPLTLIQNWTSQLKEIGLKK